MKRMLYKCLFSTLLALFFFSFEGFGQFVEARTQDRGDAYVLTKVIPKDENPSIIGMGKPTEYYVIQLARFETMDAVPDAFPQGCILWLNPDHQFEALLISGTFYPTYEDARKAAEAWKQREEFRGAFARSRPFMIRYN